LTGGQLEKWESERPLVIDGFMDWLLQDDTEVKEIAELEAAMYRHHLGPDTSLPPWSIMNQAMRQDPGLYALVVSLHPSGSTYLVNHVAHGPSRFLTGVAIGRGRDLLVTLNRPDGERVRTARLGTNWVHVQNDHRQLDDLDLGNWGDLVLLQLMPNRFAAAVKLHPASALGSACLCTRRLSDPEVWQEREVVLGVDRAAAGLFISQTRAKILTEVKRAYQQMVRLEMSFYGGNSFYIQRDAAICLSIQQGSRSGKRHVAGGVEELRRSKRARKG
jgi:hypothetical protein